MPLPNSVLRRYTAPTCTLQIITRSSPLSRWGGQAVTTLLQFELRFDDPRLPEERRVNIQGRSDQLEALHEAVTTYVQDLLKQSPDRFDTVVSAQAPPSSDAAETPAGTPAPQALDLSEEIASKDGTATPTREIYLQTGRGLSHDLFLGSLATEETGSVIHLSVLQLFDLATALDEYATDVLPLPTFSRPRFAPALPIDWASIAAVLLVAVGLTAVAQLVNRPDSQQQTAQRSRNLGSSSNDQEPIALQPSPLGPLSSPGTLPSPPPVGSVVPSPSPTLPSVTVPQTIPDLKGAPFIPSAPGATAPQTPPFISSAIQESAPRTNLVNPTPAITPPPPILINPVPIPDNSVSILQEATASRTSGAPTPSSPIAPPSAAIPSPSPGLTPFNSKNTAWNTVPQVSEVREYFNKRWEPPASLNQPLEYSLLLAVDGTIEQIMPLGQAARNYVDRTGMPLIGESFVSPNNSGQTPRVRVVLKPDGKVQTFLESEDKESSEKTGNTTDANLGANRYNQP